MPRYTYKCLDCEVIFDATHLMSERLRDCEACCTEGSLRRVPSKVNVTRRSIHPGNALPPGTIVKRHIEEAKEAIREQKQEAKKDYIP